MHVRQSFAHARIASTATVSVMCLLVMKRYARLPRHAHRKRQGLDPHRKTAHLVEAQNAVQIAPMIIKPAHVEKYDSRAPCATQLLALYHMVSLPAKDAPPACSRTSCRRSWNLVHSRMFWTRRMLVTRARPAAGGQARTIDRLLLLNDAV